MRWFFYGRWARNLASEPKKNYSGNQHFPEIKKDLLMALLMIIFIVLQFLLLLIMALHDWIEIRPLTDIKALAAGHSLYGRFMTTVVNTFTVLLPLIYTVYYGDTLPSNVCRGIAIVYGLLTLGTILSWWVPYIFGSSQKHKEGFKEFRNTHTFLPSRGDNVIPNTLHCILHVLVWLCFGIAIYLLMQ